MAASSSPRVFGRPFQPGNPGGPGNPFAKQITGYRKALMEAVSPEKVKVMGMQLWKKAMGIGPEPKLEGFDEKTGRPRYSSDPNTIKETLGGGIDPETGRLRYLPDVAAAKVLGDWLGVRLEPEAAVSVSIEINQVVAEARAVILERACPALLNDRDRELLEAARERCKKQPIDVPPEDPPPSE